MNLYEKIANKRYSIGSAHSAAGRRMAFQRAMDKRTPHYRSPITRRLPNGLRRSESYGRRRVLVRDV